MIWIEIAIAIGVIVLIAHYTLTKKKDQFETSLVASHLDTSIEMKRTLAMGLYMRFCKEDAEKPKTISSIYLKEDPYLFEDFVAKVIVKAKGGSAYVTGASNDYGVDIEHTSPDGLYLGQVKCYMGDLSFNSIALIHSNMVKQGATGGFVVTTGCFTQNAKKYAEGLNIELINGVSLVEYWLQGLSQKEAQLQKFNLVENPTPTI